jgi:hypothetical protein
MCMRYAWEFGLVSNCVLFVLVSILHVGFVGVLFMLKIPFVHGSWYTS